jgi:hypothetical protein
MCEDVSVIIKLKHFIHKRKVIFNCMKFIDITSLKET